MGAPSFKDCVAADIHGVFLNNQEFASTHTIDGKEMDAVVDDDALLDKLAAIFEERFNEAYFDGEEE